MEVGAALSGAGSATIGSGRGRGSALPSPLPPLPTSALSPGTGAGAGTALVTPSAAAASLTPAASSTNLSAAALDPNLKRSRSEAAFAFASAHSPPITSAASATASASAASPALPALRPGPGPGPGTAQPAQVRAALTATAALLFSPLMDVGRVVGPWLGAWLVAEVGFAYACALCSALYLCVCLPCACGGVIDISTGLLQRKRHALRVAERNRRLRAEAERMRLHSAESISAQRMRGAGPLLYTLDPEQLEAARQREIERAHIAQRLRERESALYHPRTKSQDSATPAPPFTPTLAPAPLPLLRVQPTTAPPAPPSDISVVHVSAARPAPEAALP
jgi:hypothetical protein